MHLPLSASRKFKPRARACRWRAPLTPAPPRPPLVYASALACWAPRCTLPCPLQVLLGGGGGACELAAPRARSLSGARGLGREGPLGAGVGREGKQWAACVATRRAGRRAGGRSPPSLACFPCLACLHVPHPSRVSAALRAAAAKGVQACGLCAGERRLVASSCLPKPEGLTTGTP